MPGEEGWQSLPCKRGKCPKDKWGTGEYNANADLRPIIPISEPDEIEGTQLGWRIWNQNR